MTATGPGKRPTAPRPTALAGPLLPVRPWRPLPTGVAVLAALLSLLFVAFGVPSGLTIVGGLCVLAVVVGWARLLALPSPRGTTGVLALAAVLLGGGALLSRQLGRPVDEAVTVALVLSLLAAFGHQLARRDGRPRLIESLTLTVAGVLLIAGWAGAVGVRAEPGVVGVVAVVSGAVVLAAVADVVRGRWVDDIPAVVLAAALAAGGALLAARLVPDVPLTTPYVLVGGLAAGLGSYALRQIFFVQPTQSRRRPQLASGAGSWLVTCVVISVLAATLP